MLIEWIFVPARRAIEATLWNRSLNERNEAGAEMRRSACARIYVALYRKEEKDETDLELSVLYAIEQGADKIVVVGIMGGRMDMTISNIQLIAHASSDSCRIEVWHGNQTGWIIQPPGEDIPGNSGDTISLIPLGGNARGIITTGMKYPLNSEILTMQTRGVSNRIDSPPVHVAFSDGLLLVVHTPGKSLER